MALVHLGGDRWRVFVEAGTDPQTGRRKRPSESFRATGKRDAEKQARAIEERLVGLAVDAHGVTFAQATEAWWKLWLLGKHSPSTEKGYRQRVDHDLLAAPFAGRRLVDIRRTDVHSWYAQLGQRMAPASVHRVHALTVQVFQHAVDAEWVKANVADKPKMPKGTVARRWQPAMVDLVAVFLAAATWDPVRARALMFTARMGMRRGEVVALRWDEHVRMVEGRLLVSRAVAIGPGGQLVEKETKAGNDAWVVLDDETLDLLDVQREWQHQAAARRGERVAANAAVWSVVPPFDGWLHPDTLTRWHTAARRRAMAAVRAGARQVGTPGALEAAEVRCAAIRRVRLHDLRHWQGGVMAAVAESVAGASLADVQKRLRHQQLGTTLGYVHAGQDDAIERQMAALMPGFRALMAAPHVDVDEERERG